mgnify:CR=1 FL=1
MHAITIKPDDLHGAKTIALLEAHRQNMFEHSPPECVFALDLDGLRQPEITFWSAWEGDEILGCGALKELSPTQAELKSMRTSARHLRQGAAQAISNALYGIAIQALFDRDHWDEPRLRQEFRRATAFTLGQDIASRQI